MTPSNPLPPAPGPLRLVMPKAPPAGWPPDVFPREIIASTHINAIRDSVLSWPGDVYGGGHVLSGVGYIHQQNGSAVTDLLPGAISIIPAPNVGPFNIYNAAATARDWLINENGHLITETEKSLFFINSAHWVSNGVNYLAVNPSLAGMGLGAIWSINWHAANDWTQAGADLQLGRAGAGALQVGNPSTGGYADVYLQRVIASSDVNAAQDVNAGRNINAAAGSVTGLYLTVRGGALYVQPTDGSVTNAFIDTAGNFKSIGWVQASQLYGPVCMGSTGYLQWADGGPTGTPSMAIGVRAPGMLHITNQAGALGDLRVANLSTEVNVIADGVVFSKNYVGALGTDGVPRATLWDRNVGFAVSGIIRWSQSDNFYDVADVTLGRSNSGDLIIHGHPDLDNMGGLQVGDLSATRTVFAHLFSTPQGQGVTGNYVIGGKTLMVYGGIITAVVG